MATIDELTQQVNTLTTIVNNITSNSVNISALIEQEIVELTSEIPASYNGTDVKIKIQSLVDLINGSGILRTAYVTKSANYTLTDLDTTVECNDTLTITLPTAVDILGKIYIIKNVGIGVVTVDANSTETIEGELTQNLTNGDSMMIQSNGTNWVII